LQLQTKKQPLTTIANGVFAAAAHGCSLNPQIVYCTRQTAISIYILGASRVRDKDEQGGAGISTGLVAILPSSRATNLPRSPIKLVIIVTFLACIGLIIKSSKSGAITLLSGFAHIIPINCVAEDGGHFRRWEEAAGHALFLPNQPEATEDKKDSADRDSKP
jgi:hypothetical protein